MDTPTPRATNVRLEPGLYLAHWDDYAYQLSLLAFSNPQRNTALLEDIYPGAALALDGNQIAYQSVDPPRLGIYELTGDSESSLSESAVAPYGDLQLTWSPDGNQIVYVSVDEKDDLSLYLLALSTGKSKMLTPWRGNKVSPAWSPDGKWIAFTSDQNKFDDKSPAAYSLYLLDTSCLSEAANCEQRLRSVTHATGLGDVRSPIWSPTGNRIAFIGTLGGDYGIYSIAPDGSNLKLILSEKTVGSIGRLTWSPDGQYIAFNVITTSKGTTGNSNSDLFVVPARGGSATQLTETPDIFEVPQFWLEIH